MSNTLVPLEPKDLTELKGVAEIFAASGMFKDAGKMEQAFVKIMAGREAGFGAFASMQNVNILQGKPAFNAHMMAAAIKRHPRYDYRVTVLSDTECKITYYQDGEVLGESPFTQADAQQAGLSGGNYGKYPRNMLFARAMSNGMRWYCPDVFNMAVYVPEELGGDDGEPEVMVDDGGVVIVVEDTEQTASAASVSTPPARPTAQDNPSGENGTVSPDATWDDFQTPQPAEDDDFPTIRNTWPQFTPQQLGRNVAEMMQQGMSAFSIAGNKGETVKALGYADWDDCKKVIDVKTTKAYHDTLESLLLLILDKAPKFAKKAA